MFGCVPAFDRYFRLGFGCSTLCNDALSRIGEFYESNRTTLDAMKVFSLDFYTARETDRRYSRAKIIDMVFFQEGLSRS